VTNVIAVGRSDTDQRQWLFADAFPQNPQYVEKRISRPSTVTRINQHDSLFTKLSVFRFPNGSSHPHSYFAKIQGRFSKQQHHKFHGFIGSTVIEVFANKFTQIKAITNHFSDPLSVAS
jgi:hypothetical protein